MLLKCRSRRFWAVVGGFLVGLGYIGLSFVIRQTVWLMLLMTSLSGFGLSFLHLITVISLKDTFQDSYPTAYATSSLGTNVGVSLFPLLLEYLNSYYGIQGGVFVFGAFLWNMIVVGLLIKTTMHREDSTYEEIGEDTGNRLSSLQDSQSHRICNSLPLQIFSLHPNFIFLFISSVLVEVNFVAWATYLVPYGQFLGYPSYTAVFLSTIGGVSGLFGKAFVAIIAYHDCLHPINIIVIPSLLIALSYTATFLLTNFTILAVAASVSGFCIGLQGSGRFSMMGNVVCAKHFNLAVAWSYSGYTLSALVGGIVTGYVRDVTGSFQYAFSFLVVICLLETIVGIVWCCLSSIRWGNNEE
ncbi:Monocarboxylate transporter 2 [Holothuria leucospilota]|uniref:Monocarboxylate transporter 2 n=1 Tax=Holothuria leucospilota TaxID=206669 RepID=A0A9Q0YN44_HOLLE|nr:Monocarboxylate transporter 2 [Holothuria leucospilota]